MGKHLVLMVHGVGEQQPGETVDEFIGAAREELDVAAQVVTSTVYLAEDEQADDPRVHLFPSHQRRIPTQTGEVVLAEAHWADLSPAPSGVMGTALDLLRLVLGLGYIALENVQNNSAVTHNAARRLVEAFVFVFYAVVGPLNLFLGIGALFVFLVSLKFDFSGNGVVTELGLGVLGVCLIGIGGALGKRSHALVGRTMMKALQWMGVLTVLFACAFALNVNFGFASLFVPACETADLAAERYQLQCFIGFGIAGLGGSWLVLCALLIGMTLWGILGVQRDLGNKQSIYIAICSAMLVFWMAFTVSLWDLAVKFAHRLPSNGLLTEVLSAGFAEATTTLVYGVGALCLILVSCLVVAGLRLFLADRMTGDGETSMIDRWLGRAIVNPVINIVLFFCAIVMSGSAYFAFIARQDDLPCASGGVPVGRFDFILPEFACRIDGFASGGAELAIGFVAVIGLGILNLSSRIAAVIGVARDITTYLTRSHAANPREHPEKSRYVHAEAINRRFDIALENLVAQESGGPITDITIMAHSQGTVLASMRLRLLAKKLPVRPTLVTMGCPVTHIYGHYFDKSHQFTRTDERSIKQWLNIYRTDDFVGTRVEGNGTWAENVSVGTGAHSHYWSDRRVWAIFKERGIF